MADGGILFDGSDGGYVSPDAITSFIRQIPSPAEYQLENILPDRFFRTNKVDWSNLTRRNRTARYRSFDGRIHSSSRDVGGGGTVQLPPLSSSMNVGELETLELAFAATGGTNIGALAEQIYNDAAVAGTGPEVAKCILFNTVRVPDPAVLTIDCSSAGLIRGSVARLRLPVGHGLNAAAEVDLKLIDFADRY